MALTCLFAHLMSGNAHGEMAVDVLGVHLPDLYVSRMRRPLWPHEAGSCFEDFILVPTVRALLAKVGRSVPTSKDMA